MSLEDQLASMSCSVYGAEMETSGLLLSSPMIL